MRPRDLKGFGPVGTNGTSAQPDASPVKTIPDMPELTLRDYFAARVVVAMIRTAETGTVFGANGTDTNLRYARAAYIVADAMLVARGEL